MSLAARYELFEGGFAPVPLKGKAAFLPGWQSAPTLADIVSWPNGNTGLLTARALAVDIDVLDAEIAERIEAMAFALAGPTLVRVGRAPKRALLYRTEEPFPKVSGPWFNDQHHVEVLGDGQQLAAFGTHPETGQPYQWRPHAPRRRADLPLLSGATAREIVAEATRIMEGVGWNVTQGVREAPGFSLQVGLATGDELPKPIYVALIRAMPLEPVTRRHRRWASSILRRLIATRQGRNAALCAAVIEFRPLVAQGLISEEDRRRLCVAACAVNGYLEKVGIGQVNAIISCMALPPEERNGRVRRMLRRCDHERS